MSPGTPRISVIVPCYNLADYVGETIESVLAQDHPSFETIVVDDGSQDDSAAVLARFADRGVRILSQPNRGAAAARNTGFRAARGAAILFLDGDDIVPPGHLRALDRALDDRQDCLAFGQWDRFRNDPSQATFPPRRSYRDADPVDWLVEDWRWGEPMTQCGTWLIPRRLIERSGGWDETLSLIDDFEFFARMITASSGVRYAPEARVFYRSVGGGLSSRKTRVAAQSAFSSLLKGTRHLLTVEDSKRTRAAAATVLAAFDYTFYPDFGDLRRVARDQSLALGGTLLPPDGPPNFHRLRKLIGWKLARRVQHLVERRRHPTRSAAPVQ